jgi:hypothetical protein
MDMRPSTPRMSFADQKNRREGLDAAQQIQGRKRCLPVENNGRLLQVEVHGADAQVRDGAKNILQRSRRVHSFVERVFAGRGYAGRLVDRTRDEANLVLEIVRRLHRRLFLMIKCNYALARQNFSGNLGLLGRVSQKPRKNDTAY